MGNVVAGVLVMAAAVFGASAGAKLRGPGAFRRFRAAIAGTGLVPRAALPWVTAALAATEAATAAGLLAAAVLVDTPASAGLVDTPVSAGLVDASASAGVRAAQAALAVAAVLTAVLIAGVAVVMRRGVATRCACFGAASGQPLGTTHLVRNIVLLALLLAGLAGSPFASNAAPTGAGAAAVTALLTAVVGGTVALVLIRWEDLAALVLPMPGPGLGSVPGPGPGPGLGPAAQVGRRDR
jgi:hypothetical protein